MDIDEALDFVGGYRRWHVGMFIALGISLFLPLAYQGLSGVFIGWEPPHHCFLEAGKDINKSIPLITVDGRQEFSKCLMYNTSIDLDNTTIPCGQAGWTYDSNGYYTAVEQWNLVCDRNYLFELSQTSSMIASLAADTFCSYLIDRYGRKLMHVTSHLLICVLGIGISFSTSYTMFLVLRCIMGMFIVANVSSGLTMCMELFDTKRRTFAGIALEYQWVACYLSLPLLAYFITDWRHLQIVISAASAIWIVFFWALPESLIWLTAAGRYDEAEEILHRIARWNGVRVFPGQIRLKRPEDAIDARRLSRLQVKRESIFYAISPDTINTDIATITVPMNVPFMDLFTDACMRKHLFACSLLWFANNLVYYGLIMSSSAMAGNRFLNFLIMGFVELPAICIALYTTEKFGRRVSTIVYQICAGIPLAIVMFIPQKIESTGVDLKPLFLTLVMLSKFFISASFAVIILYCKELFPTNLRATSSGVYQILGRIGSICAPLAYYASKTSVRWLPNVVCGAVSIAAGFATFLLPETSGRRLPETLKDVYDLYKPPCPKETEDGHLYQNQKENYKNQQSVAKEEKEEEVHEDGNADSYL